VLGILGIVLLFVGFSRIRSYFDDQAAKEKITTLNEEISGLKKKNVKLEEEAVDYVKDAEIWKKRVAEKEANIETSRLIILDLRKKREEVVAEVMTLPPSRLVEELQEVLDCAQVELKDNGILFSVECSRTALAMIAQFSLIKEEINQTGFSLCEYGEALHFQEMVSWNLFGALWKLGGIVLNLRVIVKKQDIKFETSEKRRKKNFLRGVLIGVAIGGGITITFVIVVPLIKAIF
ncbi:hypothetical protein KA005_17180, partial [bacterium]|nr:hypothetical protein [bacterium]